MSKKLIFILAAVFSSAGCERDGHEVDFEYFNLSTNEVWVLGVAGLPASASPGRLMPVATESSLNVASSTYLSKVKIKDTIMIVWKENDKSDWPQLRPGENPPGPKHQASFSRAELGIPEEIIDGRLRFTYLGLDQWRIKMLGPGRE